MVCGRCVFDIVRCRLEPQVMAQGCHGNGRRMDRRDLVKDVLKLTGSHEALPASERRWLLRKPASLLRRTMMR